MTRTCPTCGQPTAEIGGIVLDAELCTVAREKVKVRLSPRQFCCFEFLMKRQQRVASRASIFDYLYQLENDAEPSIKIVDVFIYQLRKRLKPLGLTIRTERGHGYVVEQPEPQQVAA